MQSPPGVQPPPAMSTPPPTVNLPKLSSALQLESATTTARLIIARNGELLTVVTALDEEEHDADRDGGTADAPQDVGCQREPLAVGNNVLQAPVQRVGHALVR